MHLTYGPMKILCRVRDSIYTSLGWSLGRSIDQSIRLLVGQSSQAILFGINSRAQQHAIDSDTAVYTALFFPKGDERNSAIPE